MIVPERKTLNDKEMFDDIVRAVLSVMGDDAVRIILTVLLREEITRRSLMLILR